MDPKEVQSFVIIFSVVAVSLVVAAIVLFVLFQSRKNKLLREQQESENRYREEIIETQVEIREETLRNISWELHDNIGQLLTLAKIQLQSSDAECENVDEATETIGKSLTELRSLSKLINPDTLSALPLEEVLKLEVERFNRMQYLEAELKCSKETFPLDNKVEVIIFRMLQEFFTNTLKHSKASKLDVDLNFQGDLLTIHASDNGIGFDSSVVKPSRGIGLSNIKNRANLIGAEAEITSEVGKGTRFMLTYKKNNL